MQFRCFLPANLFQVWSVTDFPHSKMVTCECEHHSVQQSIERQLEERRRGAQVCRFESLFEEEEVEVV